MPIRTAIWKVGPQPQRLPESALNSEQLLEDMIVADLRLLSDEWMLIGRQEDTGLSGRIDLLAIAPDGSLVLIELKRDRSPRNVVAQALDYAYWIEKLDADDIAAIYGRFAPGRSLAADFRGRFGQSLDEDSLNEAHQIIVVAASLDDSTERIVSYLSDREIPIKVLCFQIFSDGNEQFINRAWLLDPVRAQASSAESSKEPWNGEFYCSFGHGESRSWDDAVDYGFICGGGGAWYSRTLQLLNPGDRVWVKVPATGVVGVGRVNGWAPYRCFEYATLQTCLAHLLRRCHEMLQTATRGAVRFPRQVQAHLQHALALRDRRDAGEIGDHGLRVAKGRLRASLRRILRGHFTNPDNSRLARHLVRYENALFVFLDHPGIEATNWPSEHAIRPAVVNRKSAGGNRSTQGAETQAVLMSLLRTAHQKDLDPRSLFTTILQAPAPAPQPLLLG